MLSLIVIAGWPGTHRTFLRFNHWGFLQAVDDASHRRGTTLAKLIRQERGKGLRHGHWREVKETGRNFLVDADGRQFSRVVFHLDKTLSQVPNFRIRPFRD